MRRVRSPYVAEVLDADVTGEYPYIVTRFVSGPTLEEMVRGRGPLSGQGLRQAGPRHGRGADRDPRGGRGAPRPQAGQRDEPTDDRPIVIDFGIAQTPDATRLTQTGLVMGTPGYLAPEAIYIRQRRNASDVHSWGSSHGVRRDRPPAVRRRLLRDDLLPDRVRPRRPDRRPRAAGPADLRRAGQGPLAPPVGQLAQRPGHARSTCRRRARPRPPCTPARRSPLTPPAAPQATFVPSLAPGESRPPRPRSRPPRPRSRPPRPRPARRAPGAQAPQAPRQAARDVADLLPPVDYAPPQRSQRSQKIPETNRSPSRRYFGLPGDYKDQAFQGGPGPQARRSRPAPPGGG